MNLSNKLTLFLVGILLSAIESSSVSLSSSSSPVTQVISSQPSDVIAVSGERARLLCSVQHRQGPCQWTKDGFGLGEDPDLPGYARYSLDTSGDKCDLMIFPVLAEDEAEYQCQVGPVPGSPGVSSDKVSLTVYHEPGVPHILEAMHGDTLEVERGQELKLECETMGGKPVADIVWRHGDGSKVEAEVMDIVTRMEDQRTFRTRSVIKMIPEKDETIFCEASSSVFPEGRKSQEVKIKIRGQISVSLEFSKEVVMAGDSVDVKCNVENGNNILTYKWFLNNVEMKDETLDTIRLENVATQHNNLMIKCLVKSNEGQIEVEEPLIVKSPLRIVEEPGRHLAQLGDMISLRCLAEGGAGELSYVWTRARDNKLMGVGRDLRLELTRDTLGELTCTVLDTDGEKVTGRAELVARRPPEVTVQGAGEAEAGLGSTAVLSCHVDHSYNGTRVIWTRGEEEIRPDGVKFKIVKQRAAENMEVIRTDLVILNVEEEDFRMYQCVAINSQGQDSGEIELKNENFTYSLISYIINFVGAIIVFGAIGVGVYLWKRKRGNKSNVEFMEEEKRRYLHNQIFKGSDLSPFDKLLAIKHNSVKNHFNVNDEFVYDEDEVNELSKLNLKKPKRINRFYSAPNGSFNSDNTVISFINDED